MHSHKRQESVISAPSVESDVTEFPSYPSVHHTPSIKSQQPLPYTGPSPSSSSSLSFVSAKSSSLEPFQDPVVMASTISTTNNPAGRLRSNSNKAPNQISISKLNFIYSFIFYNSLLLFFFFFHFITCCTLFARPHLLDSCSFKPLILVDSHIISTL